MIALLLTAAVACAVLSALEAAIVSVSQVRLEHGSLLGGKEASLSHILRDPRRLLLSLLLLDTLTRLLGFALLFLWLTRWLGNWGYLAAFAAGLPLYLLICELLPKALARSGPYRFLLFMHPFIQAIFIIPGWLFGVLGSRRPRVHESQPREQLREEFQSRLLALGDSGVLSSNAAHMMHNLLDLRKQRAADHLSPLPGISLQQEETLPKLRDRLCELPLAPLPVIDSRGKVLGILDVDAVLRATGNDSTAAMFVQTCPLVDPADSVETAMCLLRNPPARLALMPSKGSTVQGFLSLATLAGVLMENDAAKGAKSEASFKRRSP